MKRKPGRPAKKRTTSSKQRVADLKASGWPHDQIAAALGIELATLELKYEKDLSSGALNLRADLTQELIRAGKKGNVASLRRTLNGNAPKKAPKKTAGMTSEEIESFTAHIGTEWEFLLPDNRALLGAEQRLVVDAAIAKKREELKK